MWLRAGHRHGLWGTPRVTFPAHSPAWLQLGCLGLTQPDHDISFGRAAERSRRGKRIAEKRLLGKTHDVLTAEKSKIETETNKMQQKSQQKVERLDHD